MVEQYIAVRFLHMLLDNGRKHWSPTCGEGSQDHEVDAQLFLASVTTKVAEEIKAQYERQSYE